MTKASFFGSVLTVGVGAGAGGLVLRDNRSGNQERYKTTSLDRIEEDFFGIELLPEESPVDKESEEDSISEKDIMSPQTEVLSSEGHESESFKVSEVPKKCEVFLIKKERDGTASVFDDWEEWKTRDLSQKRNESFWKKVETGCENGKVYVSKPYGRFSYSEGHQKRAWSILNGVK